MSDACREQHNAALDAAQAHPNRKQAGGSWGMHRDLLGLSIA